MAIQYGTRKTAWKILWILVAAALIYLGIKHRVFDGVLQFIGIIDKEATQKWYEPSDEEKKEVKDEYEELGYD